MMSPGEGRTSLIPAGGEVIPSAWRFGFESLAEAVVRGLAITIVKRASAVALALLFLRAVIEIVLSLRSSKQIFG